MVSADPPNVYAVLWAQGRFDPELVVLSLLLLALLAAGSVIVIRVRRWRSEKSEPLSIADLLQSYQALVERGELDAKEFERIKARLEQTAAEQPPR